MVRQGHGLLSNGQAGTTCSSDDDAGFHSKPPLNFVRPAFEVVAALSLVMFAGGGIVLLNRFILVDLGFAYPIAVAAVGQSATALFALLAFRSEHTISWRFYWTNIAFIGFASAASLALGQAAYLYLTGAGLRAHNGQMYVGHTLFDHLCAVAFVQILRTASPVITLVLLWLSRIERPSPIIWLCVLMMTIGAAVAACGELNFSTLGVMISLCGSLCEGSRLVLTQRLLVNLKFSAAEGLYYSAPITAFWMVLACCVFELPAMLKQHRHAHAAILPMEMHEEVVVTAATISPISAATNVSAGLSQQVPVSPFALILQHPWVFCASAALGICANMGQQLTIKVLGSIAFKVVAAARSIVLLLYAVVLGGDSMTVMQIMGYAWCELFFVVFFAHKHFDAFSQCAHLPRTFTPDGSADHQPAGADAASAAEPVNMNILTVAEHNSRRSRGSLLGVELQL